MSPRHVTYISARAAVLAAAAGVILAAPVHAQAQAAPACPAGYWEVDTVYSNAEGKVHSARGMTVRAIAVKHGGQVQDWQIGALCMQTSNGDVWIFDVASAGSRSASR